MLPSNLPFAEGRDADPEPPLIDQMLADIAESLDVDPGDLPEALHEAEIFVESLR